VGTIAIVGGGIAGLAAARAVRQVNPSADLVVLEGADHTGGVIRSESTDGYLLEWAASSFIDAEVGAAALCRELGVELAPASPAAKKRWVWRKGGLRAVPSSPPSLVSTDLLSIPGKLRLLLEPFIPRATADESIASFGRRRLGGEAVTALLEPFVLGIFAGDAERLSIRALPRLSELEARYGSLVRGAFASRKAGGLRHGLVAPRAGVGELALALTRSLGTAVRTGARVMAVEPRPAGRFHLRVSRGNPVDADAVALALPPVASADLLAPLDEGLASRLRALESVGVVVVHAGFRRDQIRHPLDGFGFLVGRGERPRLLGCVMESSIWPARAPEGHVLLRMIYGGARDPAFNVFDDDEVTAAVREDLKLTLGIDAAPVMQRIVRHRRAIPQYLVGHTGRVADIEARAERLGIALAGSSFHGVAVNDCVRDAQRVASLLLGRAASRPTVEARP
jgi:protoporphyrinogen/coproporphyrinogen III oxidase